MSCEKTCQRISRRDFLRLTAGTAAVSMAIGPAGALSALASGGVEDDAAINALPATLFDVSRCVGCGSCEEACTLSHDLNPAAEEMGKLTANHLTFVDEIETDRGERWIQRQCMHCLEPACVGVCTVGALRKSREGAIVIDPRKCIGCRYCQYACPFGVPTYDWADPLGIIHKCDFCIDRQRAGEMVACVEACPSGALRTGTRAEMLAIAHARIEANPDRYVNHVYGEFEVGGTRRLYISDVPFSELGVPLLDHESVPEKTVGIMEKTPVIAAGVAGLATAIYALLGRRNEKRPVELEEK